jgi:hypothetical protein
MPGTLFFLLYAKFGFCAREVISLQLTQKSEDLVIGEKGRTVVQNLRESETLIITGSSYTQTSIVSRFTATPFPCVRGVIYFRLPMPSSGRQLV